MWNFVLTLQRMTQLYWARVKEKGVVDELRVRWDSDVTAAKGEFSIAHIQALDTLKRFEGCFTELRHLNVENILVFEGLAKKNVGKYKRTEFNNNGTDLPLRQRDFSFGFEFNNCQIHITNLDYLPVLTVIGLPGKKESLIKP
jgi:hypothetical protein